MKRIIVPACILISIFISELNAQKFAVELSAYPSTIRNYSRSLIIPHSGIGISYFYGERDEWQSGLSYRSVPWGSEVSISEGKRFKIKETAMTVMYSTTTLFFGIPLYYNKLSFSTAIASEINLHFVKFQRIFFSGGLRYNLNPSYRKVSSNYSFLEGKVGLHITLKK